MCLLIERDEKIAELERHIATISQQIASIKSQKKKKQDKPASRRPSKVSTPKEKKPVPKEKRKRTTKKKEATKSSKQPSEELPEFTFDQKKDLSERINNLQGDSLNTVVNIIQSSMPNLNGVSNAFFFYTSICADTFYCI